MRSDNRSRPALRLIRDGIGTALFQRNAINRFLNSGTLFLPTILILLSSAVDNTYQALFLRSQSASWWIVPLITLFSGGIAFYWLLVALAACEPTLTALIRLAEEDPLLLFRSEEQRPAARTACLTAIAISQLIRSVIQPFLAANLVMLLALGSFSILLGFGLLVRMLRVHWRFDLLTSAVIATGPAAVAIGSAVALYEPAIAMALSAILILLLWPATKDIRSRTIANMRIREFLKGQLIDPSKLTEAVHDLRLANSPALAERLLDKVSAARELTGKEVLKVRILSAAGRHMEALDSSSKALESGASSAELHLAIAEACLDTDDPGNAAAHAQEAYERGSGPEALLLLATSLFVLGEMESGASVCRRILSLRHSRAGKRERKLIEKAKLLLRRYDSVIMQEV